MKPLTAAMIVEANREYWSRPEVISRWKHLDETFTAMNEQLIRRVMDIIHKRVKAGWPTREDGGDIC